MHLRLPPLLCAAVVAGLLAGCSSDTVIDVPESAGTTATSPAPGILSESSAPSEPAPADPAPTLVCETALPPSVVEDDLALPQGSVSVTPRDAGGCAYAIAGNPTAVVITLQPARLSETFVGAGEAQGALSVPLGSAAFWLAGDGVTTPSELAVLVEDYELHVRSYVGEREALVDWAVAVLASVDVELVVA